MPPEAAAPVAPTEADLIANIEQTLKGGIPEAPAPAKPAASPHAPAKPAEAEDAIELDANPEASAETDETIEPIEPTTPAEPEKAKPEGSGELAALREQMAEMRGMLQALSGNKPAGKDARITESSEGAAAPSGASAEGRIAKLKTALAAAKEANGDVVTTDLAQQLIDTLEAELGEINTERTQRKQQEKAATEQQQQQATNAVHNAFTAIAKTTPELTAALGTGAPSTHTPEQQQMRIAVHEEALKQMHKSHRLVQLGKRTAPYTENQAIVAAVKEITGLEPKTFTAEQQAQQRARMKRPEGGAVTSRPGDGKKGQSEADLVSAAESFLRGG